MYISRPASYPLHASLVGSKPQAVILAHHTTEPMKRVMPSAIAPMRSGEVSWYFTARTKLGHHHGAKWVGMSLRPAQGRPLLQQLAPCQPGHTYLRS